MCVSHSVICRAHECRTSQQFEVFTQLMIKQWILEGETAVADWFRREYLTPPFTGWHTTASGIPGNTPNNNSQESYHREEKRAGKLGLEFGVYLETGLIRDLHRASVDVNYFV